MPCLVPTINGYKRLVESYWAPVNGQLSSLPLNLYR